MKNKKILIVEDEEIIAEIIKATLEKGEYEVAGIVKSGEEALEKVKQYKPDLILMDILLEGAMDGIETATRINSYFETPIIFLTGLSDEEIVKRVKITEQYGYLIKPFEQRELYATIEIALYKAKVDKAQKQVEEDIKKAKDYAEHLYKVIPSGIFTVDQEKRITSWNDRAAKITGYSAQEILGRKCSVFAMNPCTKVCGLLSADIAKPVFGKICDIKRKDGQILNIKKNVDILKDSKGNIVGGIESFEDITELTKIENSLQSREKALHAIANISEKLIESPDWQSQIQELLKRLLGAVNASRSYIFRVHESDEGTLIANPMYESLMPGITPQINKPELIDFSLKKAGLSRWEYLFRKKQIIAGRVSDFPYTEQQILLYFNLKSIAVVPITIDDKLWGLMGFDDFFHNRDWSEPEVETLMIAGNIIGNAIQREKNDDHIRNSEKRYRILFEGSPVSLLELDVSNLYSYIKMLIDTGTTDLMSYLHGNPEFVTECAKRIKVVDLNKASLNIFNAKNKAEIIAVDRLFTPETWTSFIATIASFFMGTTIEPQETTIKTIDGKIKYVTLSFTDTFFYKEKQKWILSVFDITKRKEIEIELKEKTIELNTIFNKAPVLMLLVDEKGKIISINDNGTSLGKSEKDKSHDMLCGELLDCITSYNPKGCGKGDSCKECKIRTAILDTFQTEKSINKIETSMSLYRDKQIAELTFLISTAFLKLSSGKKVLVCLDNISERKQMEQDLIRARDELETRVRERTKELSTLNTKLIVEIEEHIIAKRKLTDSKKTLQVFLDAIPEIAFLIDKDGKVIAANKAVTQQLDRTYKTIVGNSVWDLDYGQNIILFNRMHIDEVVKSKRPGRYEITENGKTFINYIYPVFDIDESITRLAILSFDTTRQKVLEKQVIQNQKLASLGLLISSIAHEINNPNNFITFNIPILKRYIEDMMPIIDNHAKIDSGLRIGGISYLEFQEDIMELLDNIEYGSKRISSTISDLKNYSRKTDKKEILEIHVQELLARISSLCRGELNKTVKSFKINAPENPIYIHTDPKALEQVLVNLIINAAHASDKKNSWVNVGLFWQNANPKSLCIEVSDNGKGMDETTKEKIFDPFFTTKGSMQGTGLGLSISHNLIEGLGGEIYVDSLLGKSTTFKVIIPDLFNVQS